MNTSIGLEVDFTDINLITVVKKQVDELYERAQIFSLSLETLELTRRFNKLVSSEGSLDQMEAYSLVQLVNLTRHLERNLVQELK